MTRFSALSRYRVDIGGGDLAGTPSYADSCGAVGTGCFRPAAVEAGRACLVAAAARDPEISRDSASAAKSSWVASSTLAPTLPERTDVQHGSLQRSSGRCIVACRHGSSRGCGWQSSSSPASQGLNRGASLGGNAMLFCVPVGRLLAPSRVVGGDHKRRRPISAVTSAIPA